ncbi:hypothetical protein, partial [Lapidilactobacillus gannanensis]|uniref:hypothetical protein n=1 Tax=Lapidilactobacillus gannanensis TaxID=2486002 RepID=UPI001CDC121D
MLRPKEELIANQILTLYCLKPNWILADCKAIGYGNFRNTKKLVCVGYTPSWVDKQIIKACLPRKEFLYGP